jgi:hypothetical protein
LLSDITTDIYERTSHDILNDVWENSNAEEDLYKEKYGIIPKKELTIEEENQYMKYRFLLLRLELKKSFYLK